MLKINKKLTMLSNIFDPVAPLYIVGGYVRDGLRKKTSKDVDLCSKLNLKQIDHLLKNTDFKLVISNKFLNTAKIIYKNKSFDYSTFREDFYKDGKHNPKSVKFSTDIKVDAGRRDFSINALYFQIKSQKIFDFYDGQTDLKNKIIKTIKTPEEVLKYDGDRILRMVRLAVMLNFEIDKKTFDTAKKFITNLADLSFDFTKKAIEDFKKLKGLKRQRAKHLFIKLGAEKVLPEILKI